MKHQQFKNTNILNVLSLFGFLFRKGDLSSVCSGMAYRTNATLHSSEIC